MFGIGLPEMIVILVVALLVVGPDKLPDLARSLAKGVMDLKKTAENVKNELVAENPLPDMKNELKAALPNLADLKSDLDLPELPNLQEAAKRFQEDILDVRAEVVTTPPENTEETDAIVADENAIAATEDFQAAEPDAEENAPAALQASAEENVQPDAAPSAQANTPS